jgi:hypothetical protein
MQEGEYGKARLWGAVGWGLFSPLSGIIMAKLGPSASFDANLVGGVLALLPTVLLPTQALEAKKLRKRLEAEGGLHGDTESLPPPAIETADHRFLLPLIADTFSD